VEGQWRIELFGRLRATCGDRSLTRFRKQKVGSLLAYLAYYRDREHARDALVEALWPELDLDAGRNNLRVILHALRQTLGETGLLIATRTTLGLDPGRVSTDVAEWDAALQSAQSADEAERLEHLTRAVSQYRGELLTGLFEEWVLTERAHLAERHLAAVHDLALAHEQRGDLAGALEAARRAVRDDPLREEAHYDLMRLYAVAGQPSATLRQYRELERLLREHLDETPSAATRALAEELQRNAREVVVTRGGGRAIDPSPLTPLPEAERGELNRVSPDSPSPFRGGGWGEGSIPLPFPLTRFFGREEEIVRLAESLCRDDTRLLTLTGPGGSGKTRLALAVMGRLHEVFGGALVFVPLAELMDAGQIVVAIAETLGLAFSPHVGPLTQVVEAFSRRPWLLVLDNLEHLLPEGARELPRLLARAPSLTCLVTSRQRLNLTGEQEFALLPLPTPRAPSARLSVLGARCSMRDGEGGEERQGSPSSEHRAGGRPIDPSTEHLLQYPSVQLFLDRARAVRPEFQLTGANATAVAALCDRLDGLPLALELVAARASVLTPEQMLAHLAESTHASPLLASRQQDAPERHRTLQTAIESSVRLLTPELQRCFAHLSVFRGGWTLAAAEAVLSTNGLNALQYLRDCSLILAEEQTAPAHSTLRTSHPVLGGLRFRMLETLREFGAARVSEAERDALGRRHAQYFLGLAEAAPLHLIGPDELEWRRRLDQEHDNLRAALAWCLEHGEVSRIALPMAAALGAFWTSQPAEGRAWLAALLAVPPPWTRGGGGCPGRDAVGQARAGALHAAGWLAAVQGDLDEARALLEESLLLWRACDDPKGIATALHSLGYCGIRQRDIEAAHRYLTECVALRRTLGDAPSLALSLDRLGATHMYRDEGMQARTLYEEALAISRACGARSVTAYVLHGLGWVVVKEGEPHRTRALCEESLAILREVGDKHSIQVVLNSLAHAVWLDGERALARSLFEEDLALARELGDVGSLVKILEAVARLAQELGNAEESEAFARERADLLRRRPAMAELPTSYEYVRRRRS
jgi:predicted ATPase/DNA-binding SARP family transcriptional activator